jgi:hypothetical protein
MNSSRIAPDFFDSVSVTSDLSGGTYWNEVLSVIYVMTLTVFIGLCLVGCGFMVYALLQWIRDTQPQNSMGGCEGSEGPHVVTFRRTSRNKVNVPTATDDQLLDIGQGAKRFEPSLHHSERLAYDRIVWCLTPRKGRAGK